MAKGERGPKHTSLQRSNFRLFGGNLNSAAHAFGGEHEIDHPSELVRNEIADKVCAVAGLNLGRYRGTASLAPL
jgi:hypothetical protein